MDIQRTICLAACGAILGCLVVTDARAGGACVLPATDGVALNLTPVTLRILQSDLIAVPATDGLIHLSYAAQVTNLDKRHVHLESVETLDAARWLAPSGSNSIIDIDGRDITGEVRPFKPPLEDAPTTPPTVDTRTLEGGGSGIMFFDVRYARDAELPHALSHRLRVAFGPDRQMVTEYTDPIPVGCREPAVLSPPLVGHRWWNGNGCCHIVGPHRGATLPVNGDIRAPEQFAIDYVQIRPTGDCCTGPVKELSSWPFFGDPVLAAADGVVVERVDGMPEQVPGEVKGVTAQNAAGNNIIEDIGEGRFILYAHFKTDSIPASIDVGTKLHRGEQIGRIGNTGSSTAPHLHFQVMDRPSALNAIGLPFVFDRQMLEGHVAGTARNTNDTYEAGAKIDFVKRDAPLLETDLMPAETQVFSYNVP